MHTSFAYLVYEAPILAGILAIAWACAHARRRDPGMTRLAAGFVALACARAAYMVAAPLGNLGGGTERAIAAAAAWAGWAGTLAAIAMMAVAAVSLARGAQEARAMTQPTPTNR